MKHNHKSKNHILQDKNFYIINAVTLIAILGGSTIGPVLPALTTTFNVSPKGIELVMTAFLVPIAIATPIFGVLADRLGRKQILVPSLLLFAVAGSFCSFAQNFPNLIAWRFVQGLGAASLESLSLTMIGDLYAGKMLPFVMSCNASIIAISSAVYPTIGGALTSLSWRYPFLLSACAFPVAMLVLMVLKLPQRQKGAGQFDLPSYLKNTWKSINNRSVLGLMFAVAALFIIQFGAFITYIPILAGVSLGASGLASGLILGSMSVAAALSASQLGLFMRRTSEITLIKISFIIFAVALLMIPALHSIWLLLIPTMLFGAAQGLAMPSSQALLAGLAAQDSRAGFMAVNATVQALGQALGPVLAGITFGLWGIQGVFFAAAGFAFASFAVFNYLLTPKHQVVTPIPQPAVAANPASSQPTTSPAISTSPTLLQVEFAPRSASPTILQQQTARLIDIKTESSIDLPQNLSLIHLGKPNDRIPPNVDVSRLPNSQVVSRVHAVIRVEGDNYYLQDLGSANGTYINNYPLLPGNWYKLRAGDRISLGKGDLVQFLFVLS